MTPHANAANKFEQQLSAGMAEDRVRQGQKQIHAGLISVSRYVTEPNFRSIHPSDLEWLFLRYDEVFFNGACRHALNGRPLSFRLSPRMTSAGGKTSRFTNRAGEKSYEIAIASSILFDGFRSDHRTVTACGLECHNRLEALQRIFEHEIIHLVEQLAWNESDCSGLRFQQIARGFFLHQAHTHALITRRERAAQSGIHVGSYVSFIFEGRRLTGRVNRVTKRATVLVEDPTGPRYSDGHHYRKYYIPLAWLEPAAMTVAVSA
jgi:hypothetical protein